MASETGIYGLMIRPDERRSSSIPEASGLRELREVPADIEALG